MSHFVFWYSGDYYAAGAPGDMADELWKSGDYKSRLRVAPNRFTSAPLLLIYNAPDSWDENLATSELSHVSHSGMLPERSTVFPDTRLGAWELEFGTEREFFADRHAETIPSDEPGGIAQRIRVGRDTLTLYLNKSGKPSRIEITAPGFAAAVHYSTYETGLPEQSDLFLPPAGIVAKEATLKPFPGALK